jgi:hypothetical protein
MSAPTEVRKVLIKAVKPMMDSPFVNAPRVADIGATINDRNPTNPPTVKAQPTDYLSK